MYLVVDLAPTLITIVAKKFHMEKFSLEWDITVEKVLKT